MRTIVQLSDFHFLTADLEVAAALQKMIPALNPDAVVISGDLTQRAKSAEFESVSKLIDALPNVKVIVPGNHDIPLYNVWARFVHPLKRYKQYIQEQIEPLYVDEEIVLIGINTARSLAFKGGRISKQQIHYIEQMVQDAPLGSFKVLITHHPLEDMWNDPTSHLIDVGINAFIFGHRHKTKYTQIKNKDGSKSALVLQAGTATSTRYRNENNSFTVIKIENTIITLDLIRWDKEKKEFFKVTSETFKNLA